MSSTSYKKTILQINGGIQNQLTCNWLARIKSQLVALSALILLITHPVSAQNNEYIHQLIEQALENDPWLEQNHALEGASLSQAAVAKFWPNLNLSVDLNNVAADGFNFNQEPMSHFKLGLKQKLPRGQTNALNQRQHQQFAAAMPQLRVYREAELAMQVTTWLLSIKEAQKSIEITRLNRAVIDDLLSLVEASYKSAFGKTKQQDLIRAQLELTMNQDLQTKYQQQLDSSKAELTALINANPEQLSLEQKTKMSDITVALIPHPQLDLAAENYIKHWQLFENHPQVLALDQKIAATATQVELAEQQKKPEFVLSTSYGYRDAAPNGLKRADLFSMGVAFDLPSLKKNKTSQIVKQKSYELDAVDASRNLLIKNMFQQYQSLLTKHLSLTEREQLYTHKLIPQLQQMAESNISAYAYEGGDFTEVMRSQLASFNAQIELNQLQTEIKIISMKINLLLMQNAKQFISTLQSQGVNS